MKRFLVLSLLLVATSASAQLLAPGAAQYPSPPLGRHFLDQPVATCVIAVPCPYGDCVILKACPSVPVAAPLPTPAPPAPVTPPIATPAPPPVATPKEADTPREPVVIRIEVVPVAPDKAAPKPAPKAAKKGCPC